MRMIYGGNLEMKAMKIPLMALHAIMADTLTVAINLFRITSAASNWRTIKVWFTNARRHVKYTAKHFAYAIDRYNISIAKSLYDSSTMTKRVTK